MRSFITYNSCDFRKGVLLENIQVYTGNEFPLTMRKYKLCCFQVLNLIGLLHEVATSEQVT